MAKDEKDEQRARKDGDDSGGHKDKGPALTAYLKLLGTILVSLLLFAGLMRGCASCQKKNPLTGEEIQQPAPPPPAPPAPPPQ